MIQREVWLSCLLALIVGTIAEPTEKEVEKTVSPAKPTTLHDYLAKIKNSPPKTRITSTEGKRPSGGASADVLARIKQMGSKRHGQGFPYSGSASNIFEYGPMPDGHPLSYEDNDSPYMNNKGNPYEGGYKPPYSGSSNPPYGEGPNPPYGEGYKPPYGEGYKPPNGEGYKPPYGEGYKPPYGEGYKPPYGEGYKPPYGEDYKPPYVEGYKPPYGEGYKPPYSEGSKRPYSEGSKPPYSEGSKPPYSEGSKPPYGGDTNPPYGDGNNQPYGGGNNHPRPTYGSAPPPYGAAPHGQYTGAYPFGIAGSSLSSNDYDHMLARMLKEIYKIMKDKHLLKDTKLATNILDHLFKMSDDMDILSRHTVESGPYCPEPYHRRGDLCLSVDFLDTFLNFDEARMYCQVAKGGDLVMFRDANEFADMQDFLKDIDPKNEYSYWIGLSEHRDGDWRFIDGRTSDKGAPFWGANEYVRKYVEEDNSYGYSSHEGESDGKFPYIGPPPHPGPTPGGDEYRPSSGGEGDSYSNEGYSTTREESKRKTRALSPKWRAVKGGSKKKRSNKTSKRRKSPFITRGDIGEKGENYGESGGPVRNGGGNYGGGNYGGGNYGGGNYGGGNYGGGNNGGQYHGGDGKHHEEELITYILEPGHGKYGLLYNQDFHYIHATSNKAAEEANTLPFCQYIPERDQNNYQYGEAIWEDWNSYNDWNGWGDIDKKKYVELPPHSHYKPHKSKHQRPKRPPYRPYYDYDRKPSYGGNTGGYGGVGGYGGGAGYGGMGGYGGGGYGSGEHGGGGGYGGAGRADNAEVSGGGEVIGIGA